MSLPTGDAEIAAYVRAALAAIDMTPRKRNWRQRALGMSQPDALAMVPGDYRLSLKVPLGEMRLLRDAATERGIGVEQLVRRALGTWMTVAGYDVPFLTSGGLIR